MGGEKRGFGGKVTWLVQVRGARRARRKLVSYLGV